ncbi:MAG: hypothetical protein ABIF12_00710, partial [bacterium]
MKHSFKTGLGFGITSGIITTLGLMVGLNSGTESVLAVIGGVLTIAIADAFSDALGIHVSKEFENKVSKKEVWESTITTFVSKFFIALFFILPVLIFELPLAIKISVGLGIIFLILFSYIIAKEKKTKPWPIILEKQKIKNILSCLYKLVGSLIRN